MSGITQCWWHCGLKLALWSLSIVGGAIASLGDCAIAQIVPDSTLPNNSLLAIQDNSIDGGTRSGSNLFYSFEQFSVPTGSTAFFNNAPDIQNIISRVTGGSISDIDGLIRANASANVFLLNPNGIIFSPNAGLSVGGSWLASTASSLNFADGTRFSATAPQTQPLLSVSVPSGLQFGNTAGGIRVQGASLEVQPNKTLALVGGNVGLESGYLKAEGGRIELGSTAGTGLVNLNQTDKGWALGYEGVQNFQDIQLSKQAVVDASGEAGGDIQLSGRRIALTDTSSIDANNLGSQNGGKISIQASELIAQDGSQISASTLGAGQGGNLSVTASDSVVIGSGSSLSAQANPDSKGVSGDVTITINQLTVRDGAQLGSVESGGNGGNITLQAQDLLLLRRNSNIDAKAGTAGAAENGGNISITTEIVRIPEPSHTLGILAFTAFSAAKVLKRKQKKQKCRANIS
jgi:filamentous hemagglutinin family protein